ncbi:hypothetical protein GN244_ATG19432 [Phytophthora infestans]|uniref:Uncharacterized protein n=1 Tax=Phytophthora infestans TaxID=4787 RepID=A0A833WCX8_PHYIN|nr:hypothetical protein GN244_ATG19432 [Phytophthora infestans]
MRLSPVNEQHVQWKIIAGWKPKFRSSKGNELEDVVTGGLRAFSQQLSVEMIMGTY